MPACPPTRPPMALQACMAATCCLLWTLQTRTPRSPRPAWPAGAARSQAANGCSALRWRFCWEGMQLQPPLRAGVAQRAAERACPWRPAIWIACRWASHGTIWLHWRMPQAQHRSSAGCHTSQSGSDEWIPFSLKLNGTAGPASIFCSIPCCQPLHGATGTALTRSQSSCARRLFPSA